MMSRTSQRGLSLLALVMLLSGSGAIAAESGPAGEEGGRLPRALQALRERPEDPSRALGQVVHAAMLQMIGRSQGSPDDDWWEDEFGEVYLTPAGDLDGDGTTDMVEDRWVERYTEDDDDFSFSFETSAAAVSGADGKELWSVDFDGYGFAFPAGDLDGDSRDDVFLFEIHDLAPSMEDVWEAWTSAYVITLRAVRGNDGQELWSRAYQGADAFLWTGTSVVWVLDITYPSGVASDATGDGVPDIVMARYDGTLAYRTSGPSLGVAEFAGAFEVLSGTDGSTAALVAEVGSPDAWVVPDLTGDGLDDLVVVGQLRGDEGRAYVSAYSGLGDGPLWKRPVPAWGLVLDAADLDGDGTADILYVEVPDVFLLASGEASSPSDGFWWWFDTLRVLSGADGAELWSRSFDDAWPMVAGDADRDGGADILLVGETWSNNKSYARMLSGADGRTLRSRSQKRGSYRAAGDVDGDGVLDILGHNRIKVRKKKKKVPVTTVWSGRTGKKLWSKRGLKSVVPVLGDLNGNGRDDIVARSGRKYRALRGRDGRYLWSKAVRAKGSTHRLVAIDGSGGPLLIEAEAWGSSPVRMAARRGRTGSLRWTRTFEF